MIGTGLAAAVDAGRRRHPVLDTPVTSITRAADGRVTGVVVGRRSHIAADAVVCNADLPVAYRELLDLERPAGRPQGQVLAVVRAAGSPGCAACRRRTPPITTSTSVAIGTARSRHSSTTACGCPTRRSSSPCTASTTPRSRRPAARASTCSSRPPTSPPPTHGRDRLGERARPDRRRSAAPDEFARVSDRRGRRGGVRPDGLGTHGDGARHPVRARPHVLPDRALPAEQRQSHGRPGSCSPDRRRSRASACRWCSCRASSRQSASTSTPRRGAGRDGAIPSLACRADTRPHTCCRPGR